MENEPLQANLTGFREGFNLGKTLILELWGGAGCTGLSRGLRWPLCGLLTALPHTSVGVR